MKLEVEERILELRKQGFGYKSISTALKISRDAVRDICRKYGLTGYLPPMQEDDLKLKEIPQKCLHCAKEINTKEQRGRKAKFCSEKCRRAWWAENADKKNKKETAWYTFTCANCGKQCRVYGNENRKFCSIKCANVHRFGAD